MATGPNTQVSDVVVPEIFNPTVQQITEEKSRIIQSGAMVRDAAIDADLAGGGLTFHTPSFRDLDNDEENVSSDEADDRFTGGSNNSSPKKTGTSQEISVRLSRNQSWSTADLASALMGDDPADSIAQRVGSYWTRRLQAAFVATMKGVFADNELDPVSGEHAKNDMTNDLARTWNGTTSSYDPVTYQKGVTDFSAEAFLDTTVTMGDSMEDLGLVMVHSIVYNRMQKQNLIEFVESSDAKVRIPTFLNRIVVVDDGMPASGGMFETWLFGAGSLRFGVGAPKTPTETKRDPDAGNGGGSEILYNRVEWCIHPVGYRYIGAPPIGGPSNSATANNLANAGSWERAFTERKQIKIARLITREY